MNLLPGLYEALRLMALNDLDYAPGTIMKRIEELEGEWPVRNTPLPYQNLTLDQLRSAIIQRDEQLRVALVEVEELKRKEGCIQSVIKSWKESTAFADDGWKKCAEQLTTAQKERDEAIAAYAAMREALETIESQECELEHPDGCECCMSHSCVESVAQEALSSTIGTTFLERMRSLEVALGECVVELTNLCDLTRFECGNGRLAIMHAQALLNK